jgi:hypothetical protein
MWVNSVSPRWATDLSIPVITLIVSSFFGYAFPVKSWRWGLVVAGIQPACSAINLYRQGELASPSTSTGGFVALFMYSFMMILIIGPLAMGVSYFVGRRRLVVLKNRAES